VGKPEGKRGADLDVGRRIILKWTVKKLDGTARTGLIWLRLGKGGRLCRMRE
jgi:hypothetical protein